MKTNIVQNKFMVAVTLMACLTFIQSAAFAAAGGSSGNGNGSSPFALQETGKAKPGASVQEFLIEAFDASKNRVPEIYYKQSTKYNDGYNYLSGGFFEKIHDGAVEYKIRGSAEQVLPRPLPTTYVSTKQLLTGPLVSAPFEEMTLIIGSESQYPMSNGGTGLLATNDKADPKDLIEFRKYTENVVIFVTRPFVLSGKLVCGTLSGFFLSNVTDYVAVDEKNKKIEYCSVGYFWVN